MIFVCETTTPPYSPGQSGRVRQIRRLRQGSDRGVDRPWTDSVQRVDLHRMWCRTAVRCIGVLGDVVDYRGGSENTAGAASRGAMETRSS